MARLQAFAAPLAPSAEVIHTGLLALLHQRVLEDFCRARAKGDRIGIVNASNRELQIRRALVHQARAA